ncbi:hypothetical protein SAMN04488693_1196 [Arthrobacter subterraneus]|uniref:Uncharacterized protein n=1 Tax=Arthrobacter subterraneus TaxID=335973 RepID=A0A1G8MPB2_9MICC|nr:hypothetical protein [Arthrobacter subterraneus]SDI69696.1 hypothetical protein SAMN04488693_1196 [Arthrobacter subterraneus]
MQPDDSEVQHLLVTIAKYDKQGKPISPDSYSSGGARNADGTLIAQYDNPQLVEVANGSDFESEFDAQERRRNDARRRREEEDAERRRQDLQKLAEDALRLAIKKWVKPFVRDTVLPKATELMETKMLPKGKRLAQRLFRPEETQNGGQRHRGDKPEDATDTVTRSTASPLNANPAFDQPSSGMGGVDSPDADVIRMSEYKNRRSA